jgi:hypothetical protein
LTGLLEEVAAGTAGDRNGGTVVVVVVGAVVRGPGREGTELSEPASVAVAADV